MFIYGSGSIMCKSKYINRSKNTRKFSNKNFQFVKSQENCFQIKHALCQEAVNSILSVAFYSFIHVWLNIFCDYWVFKDDDSKILITKINMDMLNTHKKIKRRKYGSMI